MDRLRLDVLYVQSEESQEPILYFLERIFGCYVVICRSIDEGREEYNKRSFHAVIVSDTLINPNDGWYWAEELHKTGCKVRVLSPTRLPGYTAPFISRKNKFADIRYLLKIFLERV